MQLVTQTWHWLSSRLSTRAIWREDHNAPHRPCLPTVEMLGDRILLSGTTAVEEIPDDPVKGDGSVHVLIGLLKGEVELVKVQLESLLVASTIPGKPELKIDVVNKLVQESLDINDVLFKYGEAIIKGELSHHKYDAAGFKMDYDHKFNAELNDLNKLTSKLGKEPIALLLPAVQKVREAASRMFSQLGELKISDEFKLKSDTTLLKIGEMFAKMDDLLLKSAVDVLTSGIFKGESPTPQMKFEELVNKASDYLLKIEDPALYRLLLPTVQGVANQFKTLLLDGPIPIPYPNGPFTGGVSVEDRTDDLISEA